MNLYSRSVHAIATGLLADSQDHRQHLHSSYPVWPHDLDAFGPMNNGRYLQIMDVVRAEWMSRVGAINCMWHHSDGQDPAPANSNNSETDQQANEAIIQK